MEYCTNCGKPEEPGKKFCTSCGATLAVAEGEPEEPPSAPPPTLPPVGATTLGAGKPEGRKERNLTPIIAVVIIACLLVVGGFLAFLFLRNGDNGVKTTGEAEPVAEETTTEKPVAAGDSSVQTDVINGFLQALNAGDYPGAASYFYLEDPEDYEEEYSEELGLDALEILKEQFPDPGVKFKGFKANELVVIPAGTMEDEEGAGCCVTGTITTTGGSGVSDVSFEFYMIEHEGKWRIMGIDAP